MRTASLRHRVYRAVAVLLAAFCLFEAVKHGWAAALTIALFVTLPDGVLIARFASGGRAPRPWAVAYNVMHSYWPAIVLMGLSLSGWPELWLRPGLETFLAGLAWATHVTVVRAFDLHHSRTKDGRQLTGAGPY